MGSAEESQFVDNEGKPLALLLYKFDFCPYCVRVQHAAKKLGLDLPTRDTRRDPGAREELIAIGGKSQVPCLLINGEPLYESADIVRFLQSEVRKAD